MIPPSPPGEPKRGSLLVIFLTVFIDLLGFGMVLPLLPIYADQFATDPSGWQLGALMAIFSVMQLLFAPLWGALSDRIGRRPVLMIGLAGSIIFYTIFGLATIWQSLPWMFISRIGAGIAGATIPTAQAYIADSTTLEKRPKGMALIGIAFGLGFTFGPLLGFLAVPSGKGDPGPWPGFAAAILSAIALMLAIFLLPESRTPSSSSAVRRIIDLHALREVRRTPSIMMLLVAIFICVFAFANFETTLSMLIKGTSSRVSELADSPFQFSWRQICGTFAFIGITLAFVQGGIVRRVVDYVDESVLATSGALIEVVGFLVVVVAIDQASTTILFIALIIIVSGFAFMQPSLNSLLSRRSDPEKQGMVMGLGQSVNAFARILGSGLGIPLLKFQMTAPYYMAAGLIALGAVMIVIAVRGGKDYAVTQTVETQQS